MGTSWRALSPRGVRRKISTKELFATSRLRAPGAVNAPQHECVARVGRLAVTQ